MVAAPDPVGEVVRSSRQRSGLLLNRVRLLIGVLFEDPMMPRRATGMMLKTGDAVVLHHPGSEVSQTERS